jgi:transcriptional regulator with XRE-family HTH domain
MGFFLFLREVGQVLGLGPALQTLRTIRGLTLAELARTSGSTSSNLSHNERGKGFYGAPGGDRTDVL